MGEELHAPPSRQAPFQQARSAALRKNAGLHRDRERESVAGASTGRHSNQTCGRAYPSAASSRSPDCADDAAFVYRPPSG
jgi:hypothetical protein